MARNAKIVATLGPSSDSVQTLEAMIDAGIDVARLNFSHGNQDTHLARIKMVRDCAAAHKKPITILQDLQGPKLRVGALPEEGINLKAGEEIDLVSTTDQELPRSLGKGQNFIPVHVPSLAKSVKQGGRILLDDGKMELEVLHVQGEKVTAGVVVGGILNSKKGINLPNANMNISAMTDKDVEDLKFGLSQGVDCIALSFVRSAIDIYELKEIIGKLAPSKKDIPIIAKLERPEAIGNFNDIIMAADGVMVARGDLAVETSPSQVPIYQKMIIKQAALHEKPVITATQMLESMISNPRPTRAEASDVANAIFDGTDAVMLSGETAVGAYPVETVKMMATIIEEAEDHFAEWGLCNSTEEENPGDDAVSITRAARELAHDRNVDAIVVFTLSGRTALFMSKARPRVPIIAFTPNKDTYNLMGMYWGVTPHMSPFADTVEGMLNHVNDIMMKEIKIKPGQQIVLISGFPIGAMRPPNLAMIHTVGDSSAQ
ncbi:MAG: pyruvate kinase [Anaerolineae bacterium]|nr:pyruvate kinase [Anaerolineae bacterium]